MHCEIGWLLVRWWLSSAGHSRHERRRRETPDRQLFDGASRAQPAPATTPSRDANAVRPPGTEALAEWETYRQIRFDSFALDWPWNEDVASAAGLERSYGRLTTVLVLTTFHWLSDCNRGRQPTGNALLSWPIKIELNRIESAYKFPLLVSCSTFPPADVSAGVQQVASKGQLHEGFITGMEIFTVDYYFIYCLSNLVTIN